MKKILVISLVFILGCAGETKSNIKVKSEEDYNNYMQLAKLEQERIEQETKRKQEEKERLEAERSRVLEEAIARRAKEEADRAEQARILREQEQEKARLKEEARLNEIKRKEVEVKTNKLNNLRVAMSEYEKYINDNKVENIKLTNEIAANKPKLIAYKNISNGLLSRINILKKEIDALRRSASSMSHKSGVSVTNGNMELANQKEAQVRSMQAEYTKAVNNLNNMEIAIRNAEAKIQGNIENNNMNEIRIKEKKEEIRNMQSELDKLD
jgi:hypothetical protein